MHLGTLPYSDFLLLSPSSFWSYQVNRNPHNASFHSDSSSNKMPENHRCAHPFSFGVQSHCSIRAVMKKLHPTSLTICSNPIVLSARNQSALQSVNCELSRKSADTLQQIGSEKVLGMKKFHHLDVTLISRPLHLCRRGNRMTSFASLKLSTL